MRWTPVTLFADGSGRHWIVDGWHRIEAARKAKLKAIRAVIREGTKRDAILHSLGANGKHGLRPTNADKRKAVLTILNDDEWRGWSNYKIANWCKVGETMVREHRKQTDGPSLRVSRSENTTRTYVDKHGNVREMRTSDIGRKSEKAPEVPENQPEGTVGHTHGATSNLTLEESPDGTGLGEGVDPDGGVAGDRADVAGSESTGEGDAKGGVIPTSLPRF